MFSNCFDDPDRIILKCQTTRCPCSCQKCQKYRTDGMKLNPDEQARENTNGSFADFITQTISIIAFLIIATAAFWFTVAQYIFVFCIQIYHSSRCIKISALTILALLVLSMSLTVVREKYFSSKSKHVPLLPSIGWKGNKIQIVPKNPAQVRRCMDNQNTTKSSVTKNITVTITDSQAREIFRQSKLFAIPTEMKQPPALLVYLKDVILRNY